MKPQLSARWIDPAAFDIVERLQKKGYKAYLVGGCIRDLLCGIIPKDYDIATDAHPNQVRKAVYGSYVIGKRFRLVLVKRGDLMFEVATFRRSSRAEDFEEAEDAEETPPTGDNFFGTPEEDAQRRDFTVNALFYDPVTEKMIDYVNAMQDFEKRSLKMIGVAETRIQEDPIRSLRAIRLAHKIGFALDSELREAIQKTPDLVAKAVLPRKREEYLKILKLHEPERVFLEMNDLGLLKECLPTIHSILQNPDVADDFLRNVSRTHELAAGSSRPIDWYAAFMSGIYEVGEKLNLSYDEVDRLFRIEMGIFKNEIAEFEQARDVIPRILDAQGFLKRGPRRQESFLRQPGLDLAVKIAQFTKELPAPGVMFWNEKLKNSSASE